MFNRKKWKSRDGLLPPSEVLQLKIEEQRQVWDCIKAWLEWACEENQRLRQENVELRKKLKQKG